MPNWQSAEAYKRLLAAIIAAHPDKKLLDYRRIATYFGDGATYDSIEGQFRKIRSEAALMKEEVESGARAEAPPRGNKKEACDTPKKIRKPRNSPKKNEAVLSGRISKSKSLTPTKKRGMNANVIANANAVMGVKEEMESSASSMMGLADEEDGEHDVETLGGWGLVQDKDLYSGDEMWQSGQGYGNGPEFGGLEEV
ncbi:hypothetical protein MMC17_005829 [Xylographa soralifera]|nr:hypothetical protein [Xylographa soralifera]